MTRVENETARERERERERLRDRGRQIAVVLWGGREKGASRKEGEKAGGLRCRERETMYSMCSVCRT